MVYIKYHITTVKYGIYVQPILEYIPLFLDTFDLVDKKYIL